MRRPVAKSAIAFVWDGGIIRPDGAHGGLSVTRCTLSCIFPSRASPEGALVLPANAVTAFAHALAIVDFGSLMSYWSADPAHCF
jgi:hypothetical protein